MVLSSWQSHCESSPGSFDECRMAPSGRRPKTKPDDLRSVYIDTPQLNSASSCRHVHSVNNCHLSLNVVTSDPVDSVCRSWRHKQKHDWLGCTLFNWVSWVELSCVAINTTRDDEKLRHFRKDAFVFWVNRPTQNLIGWKRWVLVEKLTPFGEILR